MIEQPIMYGIMRVRLKYIKGETTMKRFLRKLWRFLTDGDYNERLRDEYEREPLLAIYYENRTI